MRNKLVLLSDDSLRFLIQLAFGFLKGNGDCIVSPGDSNFPDYRVRTELSRLNGLGKNKFFKEESQFEIRTAGLGRKMGTRRVLVTYVTVSVSQKKDARRFLSTYSKAYKKRSLMCQERIPLPATLAKTVLDNINSQRIKETFGVDKVPLISRNYDRFCHSLLFLHSIYQIKILNLQKQQFDVEAIIRNTSLNVPGFITNKFDIDVSARKITWNGITREWKTHYKQENPAAMKLAEYIFNKHLKSHIEGEIDDKEAYLYVFYTKTVDRKRLYNLFYQVRNKLALMFNNCQPCPRAVLCWENKSILVRL